MSNNADLPASTPSTVRARTALVTVSIMLGLLGAAGCGSSPADQSAGAPTTAAAATPPVATSTSGSSTAGGTGTTTATGNRTCATGGTCRIGDTGPAGGIVFSVSTQPVDAAAGISRGGLYLEAAPADTPTAPAWCTGSPSSTVYDTAVGSGAANTAIMSSCTDGAAIEAAAYTHNGFDDWFLPSKDELDLIYRNLKKANPSLGGFGDGAYWSSSQATVNFVWAQNFANGGQGETSRNTTSLLRSSGCLLRPVRAFSPVG